MAFFKKTQPQDVFVAAVEKTMRQNGVTGAIDFDPDLFAMRLEDSQLIMLGNLFGRWQSLSKREAADYLEIAVGGLLEEADQPKTFDEARPRLYPGVRDRATLESARWMAELGGTMPVAIPSRSFSGTVVGVVILDSATTMMMVNQDHLDEWGVTFDDAFAAAVANLRSGTTAAMWSKVGDGTYLSNWNDDYDASRLLIPEIVDRLEIHGDPVAFFPHRNRLIVTGSDDSQGLIDAMTLTEQELDRPSQVSAVPLVRRGGEWGDFDLAADEPAASQLARLRSIDKTLAYGSTTQIVQSVVGEDVYVANCLLAEKDDELVSSATWVDTVTILPEVDRVLFFRNEDENWMVAWPDVVAELGHLMQPTDFYPPRYRVEQFPSAEQLASMPAVEDWNV